MSVSTAIKFFEDNTMNHLNSHSKPAEWNLNAGLLALVKDLDTELRKLHREIGEIKNELHNVAHDVRHIRR
jgi:hypothetical protein